MKRFHRPDPEPDAEPRFDGPRRERAQARRAVAPRRWAKKVIALKDAELCALQRSRSACTRPSSPHAASAGRGGGARQRQYIGKLMRDIDLTRVRTCLTAKATQSAQEAQRFQRAETGVPGCWRPVRRHWRRCARRSPALDEAQWLRLQAPLGRGLGAYRGGLRPRRPPPVPGVAQTAGLAGRSATIFDCAGQLRNALRSRPVSLLVSHHHGLVVGLGDHASGRRK